ncbi:MAG TPA: hypothetical protein DGT23_15090, partial [Micromonosporaceae bacterium]|nr:hypothetical protein [Micromonosporaceae bacterium]
MWHLCTSYPGTSSPIVVLAWRIRGPLDTAVFSRAVSDVVDRHESLRTLFTVKDGEPYLVIGDPTGLTTSLVDSHDAEALVTSQSMALLDLERGPLVASRLIRLSHDVHVWCLTIHHLLADGGSAAILENEVAALYRGESLPPAPTVTWEPDPEGLQWWIRHLTGVPVLQLPCDLPRPPEKGTRAANLDHFLDAELASRLEQLARAERSTLFMVLLTALQVVLSEASGQRDFSVGIPADGRSSVEAEDAVGLFANMLALRLRTEADSFRKLMGQTRTVVIEALSRQSVPFGQIVASLDLADDPSQTQVFQTIFCLHTEATPRTDLPGLTIEPFGVGYPQALHDLVLDLWRNESGIVAAFRYDSCLFKPETIADLARRYEEVLRAA